MRDGSLILEFELGEVVGVRSNPGLDWVYGRLFRNAHRSLLRSPARIEHSIRLLVFGAFWVEARTNVVLHKALLLEVRDPVFAAALWQTIERTSLPEKVELLLKLATPELGTEYGDLGVALRRLLELRNRLAHFKDSDTLVSGPLASVEDACNVIQTAEDPPLLRELREPNILQHAQTALRLSQWLNRIENAHGRRFGIVRNAKRLLKGRTKGSSESAS